VVPDLVVERVDDEYLVQHNDRNVPRLRINASYKELLRRGQNVPAETKQYVREKLEQARWLLNAINQRRSTMVRVMEAIVEEQKEFFEKGPAFLKPLIMEDIARKVNVNVATISRVANDKYVQTPQGVREIKFFFNTGVARSNGDSMTKPSVKQRIVSIVTDENPASPLSDQEIYQKLHAEGIKMARRTVTKYREELHLPAARFRKRVSDKPAAPEGKEHNPEPPSVSPKVLDAGEDADPSAGAEKSLDAVNPWA
jgi:RNA polymerase sigma-54 factor